VNLHGMDAVTSVVEYDYASLGAALRDAGMVTGVAELHGCVCGLLCSGGGEASERWLDQSLNEAHADADSARELRTTLKALGLDTWRMLAGGELSFEPLLPDDDTPLEERVLALAEWCQGYLAGLGLGGLDPQMLDGQAREAITEIFSDFSEISRAVLESEAADDPDRPDFALAEVTEYVRVSVQIVFEELAAVRSELDRRTLH
jgi:uncharacterized protein